VDGAQTHIAGANAVSSTSFQALQKRRDVIDAEIFHRQFTGVAFLAGGELYEEFKTVAVALKGQGTQSGVAEASEPPWEGFLNSCPWFQERSPDWPSTA
jgi:hypothetical protein